MKPWIFWLLISVLSLTLFMLIGHERELRRLTYLQKEMYKVDAYILESQGYLLRHILTTEQRVIYK